MTIDLYPSDSMFDDIGKGNINGIVVLKSRLPEGYRVGDTLVIHENASFTSKTISKKILKIDGIDSAASTFLMFETPVQESA